MSSRNCDRCSHHYTDHGKRGGRCSHVTYTEERIESGDPSDGIEIRQDWIPCDCFYFVGSYIPAAGAVVGR